MCTEAESYSTESQMLLYFPEKMASLPPSPPSQNNHLKQFSFLTFELTRVKDEFPRGISPSFIKFRRHEPFFFNAQIL